MTNQHKLSDEDIQAWVEYIKLLAEIDKKNKLREERGEGYDG